MNTKPQAGSPGQIALGVIVIGLGLLFLLDNLGFLDIRYSFHFWPTVLIIFGALKIAQSRTPTGYLIGVGLLLLGVLLTLKHMGLIYLGWSALWPLLIIFIGLSVVFKSLTGRRLLERGPASVSLEKGEDDSIIDVTAILGGYKRRVTTDDFRGGEITAMMGGCELDLRQSKIRGEAVLTVFAVCGGITLKVPPDWTVILQGTPILGGFEEKTIAPPDASKRLIIRGYAIMGGLEARN
ncbi:MAG TPA: hypothetical protein DCW29_25065 [Janthinobacterium sp.]|nr:hypothetical protein [Janthinobacterium sp.]